MRSPLILLIMFALTGVVQADNFYDPHGNERLQAARQLMARETTTTVVHARSPYRNPYFQPNSNYEPQVIGEPKLVDNEFTGKLGRPPRPFTDIMMKGTYTIHAVPKADKHNKRNRVDSD